LINTNENATVAEFQFFSHPNTPVLTVTRHISDISFFHPSALTGDASRKSDSRQADKKYMDDAADGQGGKNKHF